jgi:hypothetical protein
MGLVAEWRSKPQNPCESTSPGPGEHWWDNEWVMFLAWDTYKSLKAKSSQFSTCGLMF